ncbi:MULTISPECIES: hypothetical protein [Sinorhizobium/Ensifer group]|jgi:hypothetical protein|uniref:hypothetical protein n=1 Tax=Sinorhizobium/Ensifer group TaxID=227292 RepID=UPI000725FA01|nr:MULTISPECIES: hypothetical protein [Sinorhizobium/Ensifer group]KSV75459.1 hypothetical protein N183_22140 [Sinorhizobium sp. Sb3]KSV89747.1 hypothetical protein N184_27015 [Sinorhizobium sp. GL28]MBD9506956.1 hypothetical protein [Ensifer sp. ENS10]MBV7517188.1 hypothetical protein [Ensifer sp. ENS12]
MTSKPAKDPKTGRFLPRADRAGAVIRPRARKAVRTKLGELFLEDMLSAWESRGAAAIHALIEKNPHDFLKAVAALMPKDVTINANQIGEMTDEQLLQRIRKLDQTIRPFLAAQGADGAGDGDRAPAEHE